jgi:hypothetical protein
MTNIIYIHLGWANKAALLDPEHESGKNVSKSKIDHSLTIGRVVSHTYMKNMHHLPKPASFHNPQLQGLE